MLYLPVRTAIILSGNLRSFFMKPNNSSERICDKFIKHIVQPNNADIFAYTDTNDFYLDGTVYYTDKTAAGLAGDVRKSALISNEEAIKIMHQHISVITPYTKYLNIETPFNIKNDQKLKALPTSIAGGNPSLLLHQHRKIFLAYDALKNYEIDSNITYDLILKWRFDNSVSEYDHNFSSYDFTNYDLYICGIWGPLVYDWHFFGTKAAMDPCLSIYTKYGAYANEGQVYSCNKCSKFDLTTRDCPDNHNDKSEITYSSEYHLFRAIKDNNIRITNSSYHGGSPYRYE